MRVLIGPKRWRGKELTNRFLNFLHFGLRDLIKLRGIGFFGRLAGDDGIALPPDFEEMAGGNLDGGGDLGRNVAGLGIEGLRIARPIDVFFRGFARGRFGAGGFLGQRHPFVAVHSVGFGSRSSAGAPPLGDCFLGRIASSPRERAWYRV